ncbi:MAG: SulP family inorganic anion transporter [Burkholderiales bacterium]|nr:SulP family inorganic anion transporter [Burkholderiales bacterium]
MSRFARWLPFLAWPRPDAKLMRGEFLAGLTVALIIVPQSVAYAALAGMPLVTGIYASFLPALVAVLWSGSPRLSVGPTALTSLLVGASLSGLAEPGSASWVALAVWLALLSGLMQLALGAWRFAWILNLVSAPVLSGFTQAATVLIVLSQLPSLIGLQGGWASVLHAPQVNAAAAAFGLGSLALLVAGRAAAPRVPTVMLVVVGAGAVSYFGGYAAQGGAVVGSLPSGLPGLYWPGMPAWDSLGTLVVPAMVITLVSFLETASSAKVENQSVRKPWNDNQDLIAQGLAKLASGLTGGFPTSSSFSRSAINLYAGAKTGWATLVTVLMVLVVLLWLTPALYYVPSAVLAAVVVAAVSSLFQPVRFVRLWRVLPVEALTMGVTFVVTLVTAPRIYWGVLAGVMASLVAFLHQRLHPRIIEVGLHPDGSLRDRHLWKLPPLADHVYALRMDAELDFAAASSFERTISEYLIAYPDTRHVCLFAQPINRIDATGVEVFAALRTSLAAQGITLHVSGIKLPVEQVLARAGQLYDGSLLQLYRTDAEAVAGLRHGGATAPAQEAHK